MSVWARLMERYGYSATFREWSKLQAITGGTTMPIEQTTVREMQAWWEPFSAAGYGFGAPKGKTQVEHIVKYEPWNDRAACGVTVFLGQEDQGHLRETPYVEAKVCEVCYRAARREIVLDVLEATATMAMRGDYLAVMQLAARKAQAAIDLLTACIGCRRPLNVKEYRAGYRFHDRCDPKRRRR